MINFNAIRFDEKFVVEFEIDDHVMVVDVGVNRQVDMGFLSMYRKNINLAANQDTVGLPHVHQHLRQVFKLMKDAGVNTLIFDTGADRRRHRMFINLIRRRGGASVIDYGTFAVVRNLQAGR